jgi:hypothetical protein
MVAPTLCRRSVTATLVARSVRTTVYLASRATETMCHIPVAWRGTARESTTTP